MLQNYGIACDLMRGFNLDKWPTGKPTECLALIPAGQEHILEQDDGKKPNHTTPSGRRGAYGAVA